MTRLQTVTLTEAATAVYAGHAASPAGRRRRRTRLGARTPSPALRRPRGRQDVPTEVALRLGRTRGPRRALDGHDPLTAAVLGLVAAATGLSATRSRGCRVRRRAVGPRRVAQALPGDPVDATPAAGPRPPSTPSSPRRRPRPEDSAWSAPLLEAWAKRHRRTGCSVPDHHPARPAPRRLRARGYRQDVSSPCSAASSGVGSRWPSSPTTSTRMRTRGCCAARGPCAERIRGVETGACPRRSRRHHREPACHRGPRGRLRQWTSSSSSPAEQPPATFSPPGRRPDLRPRRGRRRRVVTRVVRASPGRPARRQQDRPRPTWAWTPAMVRQGREAATAGRCWDCRAPTPTRWRGCSPGSRPGCSTSGAGRWFRRTGPWRRTRQSRSLTPTTDRAHAGGHTRLEVWRDPAGGRVRVQVQTGPRGRASPGSASCAGSTAPGSRFSPRRCSWPATTCPSVCGSARG
jgi:hypothetical protein